MITPFECWNGGSVRWDGMSPPEFVFAFPPADREAVTFLQLSGRICEVLTQSQWTLNLDGQLVGVPDLPTEEISALALAIEERAGYTPVTVPYQLGNDFVGYSTIPLILWANVATGRADMYTPAAGLVQGHQLLEPRVQPDVGAAYATPFSAESIPVAEAISQGVTAQSLLQSLSSMAGDSSEIHEFLSAQGGDGGHGDTGSGYVDYGAYDPQARFEEDSAGWPGGAYQNPDSAHYEPDGYDDYAATTGYDEY